jgi:hypothetical protein
MISISLIIFLPVTKDKTGIRDSFHAFWIYCGHFSKANLPHGTFPTSVSLYN